MNAEIKQKWVEALRSGKYQQTKNLFACDGKHCAVGVLIDLYLKENDKSEIVIDELESMPTSVSLWAELESPTFETPISILDVMELNDAGHPFADLADFIECNL